MNRRKGFFARFRRSLRWALRIFLILLIVDLVYLAMIWPDWKKLAHGDIPRSSFMQIYVEKQAERGWPPLHWQPVPLAKIPRHLLRAALLAEDSRFYDHSGFDLIAIREALDYNLGRGELLIGASTISQQTVKNLYLSPSRNPLRKWHEMVLTWGLEHNLRKSRILELYLNIVEFGRGIYGVQAAAQAYYGVDVGALSLVQAAELAATLPSPVKNNPLSRTERFQRRSQRILDLLTREQSATAMDGGSAGREAVSESGLSHWTNAGAVFQPQLSTDPTTTATSASAPTTVPDETAVPPVPPPASVAVGQ